jgi:hypothetical protein
MVWAIIASGVIRGGLPRGRLVAAAFAAAGFLLLFDITLPMRLIF